MDVGISFDPYGIYFTRTVIQPRYTEKLIQRALPDIMENEACNMGHRA